MRYRKLTADGDYSFGQGQLDFWRDVPDAPAQAVQTRLLLWRGEWFLDVEEGTPYMEGVLGKHSKTTADTTIQDRILGTQAVIGFSDYASALNPDTRKLTVTAVSVDTIYGPTAVDLANAVNY